MKTMKALYEPIYIYMLCETAKSVEIKWFALTDNYHIVKASVSVLMEDDDLPVLPCMLRNSKCCAERPDCMASVRRLRNPGKFPESRCSPKRCVTASSGQGEYLQ